MIRRDLTRYYAVMRDSVRRLRLSDVEAEMLVCALRQTQLDERSICFLWAEVEQELEALTQGRLERWNARWTPEARARLVERLKAISLGDAMAVLDAVEIYWSYYNDQDLDWRQALALSRLTTEIPDPNDPERVTPPC